MATIYISGYLSGGTPFNYEIKPNDIQTTIKNIGDDIVALDGTTHRYHRNFKKQFKLKFQNVSESVLTTLHTVFMTPDEFIFQDIDGSQYSVLTEKDSFNKTLTATKVSLRGVKVYDIDIGLIEV
jgi:hypothetical protein